MALTFGEYLIKLLARFGVDHVIGIHGVHSAELYRDLTKSAIKHVPPATSRERVISWFKSLRQAQRFATVHDSISNLFLLPHHAVPSQILRPLRENAMATRPALCWQRRLTL